MNVLLAPVTLRTRQVLDFIPSRGIFVQKAFLAITMAKKRGFILSESDLPTVGQISSTDSQAFLIYSTEQKLCRSISEMLRRVPGASKAGLWIIVEIISVHTATMGKTM